MYLCFFPIGHRYRSNVRNADFYCYDRDLRDLSMINIYALAYGSYRLGNTCTIELPIIHIQEDDIIEQ